MSVPVAAEVLLDLVLADSLDVLDVKRLHNRMQLRPKSWAVRYIVWVCESLFIKGLTSGSVSSKQIFKGRKKESDRERKDEANRENLTLLLC